MQVDASQRSVVVADDSSLMRDVLRSKLSQSFGPIHLACDGLEAVEAARATQAVLVILDYRMGKLNGIEACREIRALPGYAKVPIVLLTGYDDEKLHREAERGGISFVLRKPIIYEHLLERLVPYGALLSDPVIPGDDLARGRDVLHQRRRIEAETDDAKRRYSGMSERLSPFLGSWRR